MLKKIFLKICNFFVNKKFNIIFEEDKIKGILFSTKMTLNKESSLDVRCDEIHIRNYHTVTYLDCSLDRDLLGEPMALNVIKESVLNSGFCIGEKGVYPSFSIDFCVTY